MDDLPPIPTPFPQRWREFRIQVLPIIVFLITVATIVYLWRAYVHPSEIVGAVEGTVLSVTTTAEGAVESLSVDLLDPVTKGQPLCRIDTQDAAVTEAALSAVAADLKLMQARMNLDKFRNQNGLLQMRLDLLSEQVAHDLARIRLTQAEGELQRYTALYKDELVTSGMPVAQGNGLEPSRFNFGLDVARRDRDILVAEVASRSNAVVELTKTIESLAGAAVAQIGSADPAVEEAIRAQQEQLRLINQPHVLRAPSNGVVTAILKRSGEKVVEGDVILTIGIPHSHRVIGYIRQPINRVPTTNDTVIVGTRAHRRQVGRGTITRVGVQLEPINPLLLSADGTRAELGLPFLVRLPEDMLVVPGEFVDLQIEYASR